MEWVSMARQLRQSLKSSGPMESVRCSGIKRAATALQSSGDILALSQFRVCSLGGRGLRGLRGPRL